jgi:hypothetical protein
MVGVILPSSGAAEHKGSDGLACSGTGPKSETRNSKSETMTKIQISNDQNGFSRLDVSNLEDLKFEFVSSFEFRYSSFRPPINEGKDVTVVFSRQRYGAR